MTNEQLVEDLFENVLHGTIASVDPAVGASLIAQLNAGTLDKGALLLWFANHPSLIAETAPVMQRGLWVESQKALEIDRLYQVGLDRGVDVSGLSTYLSSGFSSEAISQALVASPEFATSFGSLTDDQFVARIYQNGLGRAPTPSELSAGLARLAGGALRGALVSELANGEASYVLPPIEGLTLGFGPATFVGDAQANAIRGSINNETFQGGLGNDVLIGGGGSDTYSFAANNGQDIVINGAPGETGPHGHITLGPAFRSDKLWFSRSEDDLVIKVMGSSNRMTVQDWFDTAKPYAAVQDIALAFNSTKLDTGVNALVQAMAAFEGDYFANTGVAFDPTSPSNAAITNATVLAAVSANWHQ